MLTLGAADIYNMYSKCNRRNLLTFRTIQSSCSCSCSSDPPTPVSPAHLVSAPKSHIPGCLVAVAPGSQPTDTLQTPVSHSTAVSKQSVCVLLLCRWHAVYPQCQTRGCHSGEQLAADCSATQWNATRNSCRHNIRQRVATYVWAI